MLAVRISMGRPVFFRQTRAGLGGRLFEIVKLRTMRQGDAPDAERLTPIGRFLRKTSLDELPELLLVLKGDMSLVGPRPLPARYLARYSKTELRRHDVPPGITGLAQTAGRNFLSWKDRFRLDLWYTVHAGPLLDLAILARTVAVVALARGVSAEGEATMGEFLGNPKGEMR